MAITDWYEIVEQSAEIEQGDLLRAFPVLVPIGEIDAFEGGEAAGEVIETDVVVLSQSCDIENDKIKFLVLAEVLLWEKVVEEALRRGNSYVKSTEFRKKLVAGEIPNLALLKRRHPEPSIGWSVVDFHKLHVAAKGHVARVASRQGNRLRLKSPYREFLSQSLGRYFMRVALPADCREFVSASAHQRG